MMMLKHGFRLALVCLLIIWGIGCANTVTVIDGVGNEIQLSIQTSGASDFNITDYYILISPTSNPSTVSQGRYFTAPGQTVNTTELDLDGPTLHDHYADYFASWTDYIKLTNPPSFPELFESPFALSSPTLNANESKNEHENNFAKDTSFTGTYTKSGSTLTIRFLVSLLKSSTVTAFDNRLYFTIVTLNQSDGRLQDVVQTGEILLEQSNRQTGTDVTEGVAASAELLQWTVDIF